jgi:hypothetical protein
MRRACSLAPPADGGVAFLDTAAGAQTSLRMFAAINEGPVNIIGRERIMWSIEGPDAAEFEIAPLTRLDPADCRYRFTIEESLRVGQECLLPVVFRPTTVGPKQATLHVQADSLHASEVGGASGALVVVDQVFPITATAVAAQARLYASSPELYVDPPSEANLPMFQIINGGTTSVDLGAPVVTAPFRFGTWNCPSALMPGGSCMVSVGIAQITVGCPAGQLTTTTSALTLPLAGPVKP